VKPQMGAHLAFPHLQNRMVWSPDRSRGNPSARELGLPSLGINKPSPR
jgi:hypothetical protein